MENNSKFIKGVEKLIDPIEVGSMHFLHGLNKLLPRQLQDYLSKKSSTQIPYMGFVVEPYSSFLFYKITDLKKAKSLIPKEFDLIKTKVFEDDNPEYYAIFGCFRAHTSAFWGSRVEFYMIAQNRETGLLTWVIVDYDSNTIGQDKKYGLRGPNSSKPVITINHRGQVYVDVSNNEYKRTIAYNFNVSKGEMTNLDQRLWLEGNLSIVYGKELNGSSTDVFSLKFEPCEVEKALQIKPSELQELENTWYPEIFDKQPSKIVCFPYAQHFLSDTPGHTSKNIQNREQLESFVKSIEIEKIKTFSVKSLRDLVLFQSIIATIFGFIILLLIFLLLKE